MKFCFRIILLTTLFFSCNAEEPTIASAGPVNDSDTDSTSEETDPLRILSLGDSYTIGQSVCFDCKFPVQLRDSIRNRLDRNDIELEVIAQTGWTTTNLINAIDEEQPPSDFDLVTLLIGVNNQYQGIDFSVYQTEFVELVNTAISKASGDMSNLMVVSIPDYAFTPFGQNNGNPETISQELEQYNDYAEAYCSNNGITYVYITDITQLGLEQPELVAVDQLHPSELAYSLFVERILPLALQKIE